MSKLRFTISMSLDGYAAGPNQSESDPLGVGGERLHDWFVALEAFGRIQGRPDAEGEVNASTPVVERRFDNIGATIMGRNMFGGGPGPWGEDGWRGWWGEDPPYHHPVFVLTHHDRQPLPMQGGTTFHFVTDGIESALERAREAAGEKDIMLAGGAAVFNQYLAAGLVDDVELSVVPILLKGGERLFEDLGDPDIELEQVEAVEAPGVVHVRYRPA
jgi:dihydrofolate reductase